MILLLIVEVGGLACLVHLLLRRDVWWKKALWTPVVLLPAIGPLLYGGMYQVPTPQREGEQARATPGADRFYAANR